MVTVSDGLSATSGDRGNSGGDGGEQITTRTDLEGFFDQLDINEEEFEDVFIDEEDPMMQESVRWLALARVHTEKTFSQGAFYKNMRAAWNPAQTVRLRPVGPNRFVVQASCLGDWDRIMKHGPWLFRNWAVLLVPYDGFSKTENINTFHMPIWLQIHKLPEAYCKDHIVEKLLKSAGEIMEMRLNGNRRGDYVRVRVNHDIREPLTKYLSIVRGKERQVYFVRYEKLAKFCKFCGLVGHDYKECGTGIHEEKSLKFGDWLYADAPNKPRGDTQSAHTYKGSIPREQQQQMPIKGGPATKAKEPVGPVTMGIATCPVIPLGCSSSGEKETRKRLNLDAANGVGTTTTPPVLLAITDGTGMDLKETSSPTSSNNSKRAKMSAEVETKEISAASLGMDRRTQ
ncbi:hypothetical protein ZWY2020_038946 [Hordeum vulgare]|nr:hypothetical protein ZWY2020_038946 [Hordeum vulgare]